MIDAFDLVRDRHATDSVKWQQYEAGVLPLWVADMDFASPPAVMRALHARIDQAVFGYGTDSGALKALLVERLSRLYHWTVAPEAIVFMPGVVPAIFTACHAFAAPTEGVLVQTPVYPPILHAPTMTGRALHEVPLLPDADGRIALDAERIDRAIRPDTRLFMLCNPQNPVGRVFSEDELAQVADVCLRRGLVICSDEIHGDLLFDGHRHVPIASLDRAIAKRTITLMAASKTYNLAGLGCAFAIIEDAGLRARFARARAGLVPHVNLLGFVAAEAAYRDGQPWLDEVLAYLQQNRDVLLDAVAAKLPGVTVQRPEGTYLAWLDCRQTRFRDNPYEAFLRHARVALNDGSTFGEPGRGFVRLNFGCARAVLLEAIERMHAALVDTRPLPR